MDFLAPHRPTVNTAQPRCLPKHLAGVKATRGSGAAEVHCRWAQRCSDSSPIDTLADVLKLRKFPAWNWDDEKVPHPTPRRFLFPLGDYTACLRHLGKEHSSLRLATPLLPEALSSHHPPLQFTEKIHQHADSSFQCFSCQSSYERPPEGVSLPPSMQCKYTHAVNTK